LEQSENSWSWEQLKQNGLCIKLYLKEARVIIIAQIPKKAYPFFKSNVSNFENVKKCFALGF
jgi:hypothetical protein